MSEQPRLLVIDDSATIRKLVELSFGPTEWSAEFSANGQDGIAAVHRRLPQAILLDFVLPDMKATDVCKSLASIPGINDVPVVIMSGKKDTVRPLFAGFPFVTDFIGKPFQASEVVSSVRRAAGRNGSPDAKPGDAEKQQQDLAQLLFESLRAGFAEIPQLYRELGTESPAAFFARRLLTPEVVGRISGEVERRAGEDLPRRAPAEPPTFSGQLGSVGLPELMALIARTHDTGTLLLTAQSDTLSVYLSAGEWCLATTARPSRERFADILRPIGAELWAKVSSNLRTAAKPALLTLAEAGAVPAASLSRLFAEETKSLLLGALGDGQRSFSFHPCEQLPDYVQGHGSPVHLASLELAALRSKPEHPAVEKLLARSESRFERAAGFSVKIRDFDLDELEVSVLTGVHEGSSVSVLASRLNSTPRAIAAIVHRLHAVGLLRERATVDRGGPMTAAILDDLDGAVFGEPLRDLLRERGVLAWLLPNATPDEVFTAIQRDKPRALIVNTLDDDAVTAAELLRAAPELREMRLLAVLDFPSVERESRLAMAGFDAVLTKPVPVFELERLLNLGGREQPMET